MAEEDESYLDQLLNSIAPEDEDMPSAVLDESSEEKLEDDSTEELEEELEEEPEDDLLGDIGEGEDLTELLGMLAEHYDEEQENQEEIEKDMVASMDLSEDEPNVSESAMGMDDVFQDALSAVSYMENENEPEEEPKKKSFRERFFTNIVDDKTIEKELSEREEELKSEEERAIEEEEKKQKAQQDKEEKERLKQEEKEKKEADKAAKAEEKQRIKAEKAAKKQMEKEEAAREVVGRINLVGAAIVVAFFAFIGIAVIFGMKVISYRSSIGDAQAYLDTGNYEKAYQAVSGIKVSGNDEKLYQKARICASLAIQLKACDSYLEMGKGLEALDSLVKAVKEYDIDAVNAEKLEIKDKQDALLQKVSEKLMEEFHMTTAEARQIIALGGREEYTARLEEEVADYFS